MGTNRQAILAVQLKWNCYTHRFWVIDSIKPKKGKNRGLYLCMRPVCYSCHMHCRNLKKLSSVNLDLLDFNEISVRIQLKEDAYLIIRTLVENKLTIFTTKFSKGRKGRKIKLKLQKVASYVNRWYTCKLLPISCTAHVSCSRSEFPAGAHSSRESIPYDVKLPLTISPRIKETFGVTKILLTYY